MMGGKWYWLVSTVNGKRRSICNVMGWRIKRRCR
jgi:hypothetical protein